MKGINRDMAVVLGALCALFRMRSFFSMLALRKSPCTFVLRCKPRREPDIFPAAAQAQALAQSTHQNQHVHLVSKAVRVSRLLESHKKRAITSDREREQSTNIHCYLHCSPVCSL